MRRLKTVRRPPIYPKTPGHLPYSLTHPLPLSSRRPSVSFGGFGFRLTDKNRPAESRGFFDRQLSLDALLEHLERGHLLGLEPQSINTVAVDIDHGDADLFLHNFSPLSMYKSKTEGRCHVFYRHDGGTVSPQPFNAPMFAISGDLKHTRSFVALYDASQLAFDLSRGSLGVPFEEAREALVTGPLAQGGQRGPLTPPVGSNANPGDSTPSPWNQRHNWILSKLTAARVDGMDGKELRRYANMLHTGLVQTPGLVPHFFELAEALAIANFVAARSYSVAHQRAAGVSSGEARRARSAARDTHILDLLNTGLSIRRTAARLGLSRQVVQKAKDRQRASHGD